MTLDGLLWQRYNTETILILNRSKSLLWLLKPGVEHTVASIAVTNYVTLCISYEHMYYQ